MCKRIIQYTPALVNRLRVNSGGRRVGIEPPGPYIRARPVLKTGAASPSIVFQKLVENVGGSMRRFLVARYADNGDLTQVMMQ